MKGVQMGTHRKRNRIEIADSDTYEQIRQHAEAIRIPASTLVKCILDEWLTGSRIVKIGSPRNPSQTHPPAAAPSTEADPMPDRDDMDEPWTPSPMDLMETSEWGDSSPH
jgi:hypothetical protein